MTCLYVAIYLTDFRIILPEDENCVFESLRYKLITKNDFYYGSCPDIYSFYDSNSQKENQLLLIFQ